jgi:hypothetical protein
VEPIRAISTRLLRLVVVAVAVFVATTVSSSAPTTTTNAATFTYDEPAVTRVDVHEFGAVRATQPQLIDLQEESAWPLSTAQGASTTSPHSFIATEAANAAGEAYPSVIHPGTGEPIPYPGEGLAKVPVAERAPWGASERGAYIKEWYDQGYATPEGGWSQYDIHHIVPREYGGTNAFENLVPVERTVHQSQFNTWWRNYS